MFSKLRLAFILFLISSCLLNAQFNFQVGYGYNWSELTNFNRIFEIHNTNHPEFSKKIEPLHGLHGISLGFRQSFNLVSLHFTWSNQIKKNYSLVPISSSSSVEFKSEYFYKQQYYSLGLESAGSLLAFGGSIDMRHFNIKGRKTGSDEKFGIFDEKKFGNTFYSQFDFPVSRRMAILIRLSYSLPWNSFDFINFSQFINSTSSTISEKDKFHQIGLSLLFSNGFQSRY